jgi:hypothetical protein
MKKEEKKIAIMVILLCIVFALLGVVVAVCIKKGYGNRIEESTTEEDKADFFTDTLPIESSETEGGKVSLADIVDSSFRILFNEPTDDEYDEAKNILLNYTTDTEMMRDLCEKIRAIGEAGWNLDELSIEEDKSREEDWYTYDNETSDKTYNGKIIVLEVYYTLSNDNRTDKFLLWVYTLNDKIAAYDNYTLVNEDWNFYSREPR